MEFLDPSSLNVEQYLANDPILVWVSQINAIREVILFALSDLNHHYDFEDNTRCHF